jgi:hypothetical protein
MNRQEIIAKLRENEGALRARGISHVALFGSVARGEAGERSDIDLLVDLDPEVVRTIYDYAGVKCFIAELFATPVDVVDRKGLKPHALPTAVVDAINAF